MSTQVAERPAPPSEEPEGNGWLTPARAGWAGVALGFLALFITVPPALIRSPVPTVILGVLGLVAGAVAIRGGERKLGLLKLELCRVGIRIGGTRGGPVLAPQIKVE